MEPLAVAGYVLVGAAAVLAVILGALAGSMARALKVNLLWCWLLAAVVYFTVTVVVESARPEAAAIIGLPPLILTALLSWLAAYFFEVRFKLRTIWATPLALCCALLVGFLWGFSLRLGLATAVSIALVTDACLAFVAYRQSQRPTERL